MPPEMATVGLYRAFQPRCVTATWVTRTPAIRDAVHASTSEMGLLLFGISTGAMIGRTRVEFNSDQSRRNVVAARTFFRRLLKGLRSCPG